MLAAAQDKVAFHKVGNLEVAIWELLLLLLNHALNSGMLPTRTGTAVSERSGTQTTAATNTTSIIKTTWHKEILRRAR